MKVLSENQHKAKINHTCDWCLEKIHAGTIYNAAGMVGDDGKYTFKAHQECDWLARKLDIFEDGAADSGDFQNAIDEFHNNYFLEKLKALDGPVLSEVIQQLRNVMFRYKLGFVLRELKRRDSEVKPA